MKKFLITLFALLLITLPSCFKQEIKKNTPVETQSVKVHEKSDIKVQHAFSEDTIPCYAWQLEQENITNAD